MILLKNITKAALIGVAIVVAGTVINAVRGSHADDEDLCIPDEEEDDDFYGDEEGDEDFDDFD